MDLMTDSLENQFALKGDETKFHCETTCSARMVKTYVAVGLTRLMRSNLDPDEFFNHHIKTVTNVIHEVGVIYVETWHRIQEIQYEARRVKKEVKAMSQNYIYSSTFWEIYVKQSGLQSHMSNGYQFIKYFVQGLVSLDLVVSYYKYTTERKRMENTFVLSMEDKFHPNGKIYLARKTKNSRLNRKIGRLYNQFRKILLLANEEELIPLRLSGQLRREFITAIALPDLTTCHFKMKEANGKLQKAERKWTVWRQQYYDGQTSNTWDAGYIIIYAIFLSVWLFYML